MRQPKIPFGSTVAAPDIDPDGPLAKAPVFAAIARCTWWDPYDDSVDGEAWRTCPVRVPELERKAADWPLYATTPSDVIAHALVTGNVFIDTSRARAKQVTVESVQAAFDKVRLWMYAHPDREAEMQTVDFAGVPLRVVTSTLVPKDSVYIGRPPVFWDEVDDRLPVDDRDHAGFRTSVRYEEFERLVLNIPRPARFDDDGYGSIDRKDPLSKENQPHRPRARKDTKRWCRGKEGREHQPEMVRHHQHGHHDRDCHESSWWKGGWWCYHASRCRICGKYVDSSLPKEQCPTWLKRESNQ